MSDRSDPVIVTLPEKLLRTSVPPGSIRTVRLTRSVSAEAVAARPNATAANTAIFRLFMSCLDESNSEKVYDGRPDTVRRNEGTAGKKGRWRVRKLSCCRPVTAR